MKRQLQLTEAWGLGTTVESHSGKPATPSKKAKAGQGYTATAGWLDLRGGSEIGYWPGFIPPERAQSIFEELHKTAPWSQRDIVIHGRTLPQPRLIAYYADECVGTYTYSNLTLEPSPFTPLLRDLKQEVEQLVGHRFNSVLMNLYRNGRDCVAWHSDDERLYGKNSTIASVSFGQARDFFMRKKPKKGQVEEEEEGDDFYKFLLSAGDAFVMRGATQSDWQHTVPRRNKLTGARISCTFRTVMKPEQK